MNLTWNAIEFLQMLDVTMQINVPYSYVKQVFQKYMYIRTFLYIVICKQYEKEKNSYVCTEWGLYLKWRKNYEGLLNTYLLHLQLSRLYPDAILVQRINVLTTVAEVSGVITSLWCRNWFKNVLWILERYLSGSRSFLHFLCNHKWVWSN